MKTIYCGLISILISIIFTTLIALANEPLDQCGIDFISVSQYRNIDGDCVYSDVLNHSKQKPHGDKHGRYTNVHETAHGIHNELRNEYKLLLKTPVNVFYCLNGKAVVIKEPKILIRHIPKYIPNVLRSSRYKVYLVEQIRYWDDTPTYILDEWTCYILGAECAVDDFYNNRSLEKTDAVSGSLEFSIYVIAMCLAIKEHDPEYWNNYPQFKAYVKYALIRAEKAFGQGSTLPEFQNKEQNRLQQALLNHADASEIRDFLKIEFGGIFVD